MVVIKETKYLSFEDQEISDRKTKIINVVNISAREVIGVIKWYSGWRQYCFLPEFNTVWNITCLTDVNEIIQKLMKDRKTKK